MLVVVLLFCALPPAVAIIDTGRGRPVSAVLLQQFDRLAVACGFGFSAVEIVGHRQTAEADVVKALALDPHGSQFTYDAGAARQRLEQLPWVERAAVIRRLPDRLSVSIVERKPIALWRHEGRDALIDASGRQIVAVAHGSDVGLLVVTGPGAAPAAPTLLALIAGYPEIRARIVEARRVGDRRWDLLLADGLEVRLPGDGMSASLARLDRYRLTGLLHGAAHVSLLDLRQPDRLVVRRRAEQPNSAASRHAADPGRRARSWME